MMIWERFSRTPYHSPRTTFHTVSEGEFSEVQLREGSNVA
jgi:hypothetical protein